MQTIVISALIGFLLGFSIFSLRRRKTTHGVLYVVEWVDGTYDYAVQIDSHVDFWSTDSIELDIVAQKK